MNFRQKAIIDIFTKLGKKEFVIWFSGKRGEGEYKSWHANGKLKTHSFWKNGKLNGEGKMWDRNGKLLLHNLWKNSKKVRNLL